MLPSLEVVKGEGPSLDVLLCLFFPFMSVMSRPSNALLTEPPRRVAFNGLLLSVSSCIGNCARGRPRAVGDPDEGLADMLSLVARLE